MSTVGGAREWSDEVALRLLTDEDEDTLRGQRGVLPTAVVMDNDLLDPLFASNLGQFRFKQKLDLRIGPDRDIEILGPAGLCPADEDAHRAGKAAQVQKALGRRIPGAHNDEVLIDTVGGFRVRAP